MSGTSICILALVLACGTVGEPQVPRRLNVTTVDLSLLLQTADKPTFQELLGMEVLYILAEQHNFTYNIVFPTDLLYGSFTNGSWNGMVGQLVREEADMSIEPMVLNLARARVADAVYPILFNRHMIMIPYAQNQAPGFSAILVPFQTEVWICILISFVSTAVALKFLSQRKKYTMVEYLLGVQAVYTGQAFCLPVLIKNYRAQVAIAGFCLAAVVIVNTYTSVLFSTITVKRYEQNIKNLADLADSKLIPSTAKGGSFENNFLEATSGTFKKIGDKIRENPQDALFFSYTEGAELTAAGKTATILTETLLREIIQRDYDRHSYCRLTLAAEPIQPSNQAFLIRKGSPLGKPFDIQVIRMHDFGLIDYFTRRLANFTSVCLQAKATTETQLEALNLTHFAGAFYILFTGYGLAAVAFITDLIRRRFELKAKNVPAVRLHPESSGNRQLQTFSTPEK